VLPLIRRVEISNYKSIEQAAVDLGPFTAMVGPNGSGKSNFVDALAFVQECLSSSIELALKNRGGIDVVPFFSTRRPRHIRITVHLEPSDGLRAAYSFEIAPEPGGGFRVAKEDCSVKRLMMTEQSFEVNDGQFVREIPGIRPKVSSDRLALYAASATDEFRPIYDFLTSMRFYSIVPGRLRDLQEPDPGDSLKRDGSNAAAILKRLQEKNTTAGRYQRLCSLLSRVADGIRSVEYKTLGSKDTLQFKLDVGSAEPWTFDALNMSDGTLRVLGLLLAVYQPGSSSVVAIEEPEATVHPAIAEMVTEVLVDASAERQILITTHSPDILDYKGIGDGQIRVVTMRQGKTFIAPLGQSSRAAIRDHLYSLGELLRLGELTPDLRASEASATQLDLFEDPSSQQGGTTAP
jgi:predicted ATPase